MTSQTLRLVTAIAFVALLTVPTGAAQQCPLVIDDLSGVTGPWPLVGGVPIPEGAVTNPAQVRVLNNEAPVPAQVDIATTYRDGSARWVLVSMMAPVDGSYVVEIMDSPQGAPAEQMASAADGGYRVDTGAAVFTVTSRSLLPLTAQIGGRDLYSPGAAEAFAVDNQGRRAVAAGDAARIEVSVLKNGPVRSALRTEGDYVLEDGTPIARGVCIMEFFAGSPMVKLTHSFVLTQSTNEIWFRDYGITVPVDGDGDAAATFDTDRAFDTTVERMPLAAGDLASMTQVEFPHFAERDSLFELLLIGGNRSTMVTSGEACGEWTDLTAGGIGCTIAVRDFAEQFPKSFSATSDAITVHLWPERSGKEMDFRSETLVRDYWKSWANMAPGGGEALAALPSDAQAAQKTHRLWLMPHAGALDVADTARRAHAVTAPVLVQADPEFLATSGALPWPLQPKDEERFPEQEEFIADFWDRTTIGFRVFPMAGFIAHGMNPYLSFSRDSEGRWQAGFYRLSQMVDYGIRRHVWNLYARSGERHYFDYGSRFNKFAGDWEMQHVDVEGEGEGGLRRMKGSFSYGDIHKPFYWGGSGRNQHFLLRSDISGHDCINWLMEHYMTGDEHALALAQEYAGAFKRHWDTQAAIDGWAPFMLMRVITALYTHDWDEQLGQMAHDIAHGLMDPESPNGFYQEMPYGPLYKVDRNASATYDYWWATGDPLAKDTFLKALDYEYRFNRIPAPIEYQNGKAYLYTLAYNMTGREVYRQIAAQLVRSALEVESVRLEDEIGDTDPYELERLPFRGPHLNMHPLLGVPTALRLMAQTDEEIAAYPLLVKPFTVEQAQAIFEKPAGQPVRLVLYLQTMRTGDVVPEVIGPDGQPAAVEIEGEERIPYHTPSQFRHLNYVVTIPATAPEGVYQIGVGGPDEFIVQEANIERIGLACPNGFWVGGGGASVGERMWFNVPEGTETVELFVGRPLTVYAADGSVALEPSPDTIGDVSLPVNGRFGAWSAVAGAPGHIKLRNLTPVVAYGAPDRLPTEAVTVEAPAPPALPTAGERFVEGIAGQALQLTARETLQFPRGAALDGGGYEHFPAREGTIELWFRPNWSSSALPFRDVQLQNFHFIADRSISFYYRYGQGPVRDNLYSYVDLLTKGPLGRNQAEGNIGGHARHFMNAGEWVHLAASWKIEDGARGTEGTFDVFINGQRLESTWNYPRSLTGRDAYELHEANEQIRIGPFDGTVDEMRISNIRRYEGDFQPPRGSLSADDHTLALFNFDGNSEGVSGVAGSSFVAE
ncbi:MAG: LamG domain-containing protein [candidate division WS1 bacterium]|nr:LamG domain-containing protein [candidate division WS1 bacterium]